MPGPLSASLPVGTGGTIGYFAGAKPAGVNDDGLEAISAGALGNEYPGILANNWRIAHNLFTRIVNHLPVIQHNATSSNDTFASVTGSIVFSGSTAQDGADRGSGVSFAIYSGEDHPLSLDAQEDVLHMSGADAAPLLLSTTDAPIMLAAGRHGRPLDLGHRAEMTGVVRMAARCPFKFSSVNTAQQGALITDGLLDGGEVVWNTQSASLHVFNGSQGKFSSLGETTHSLLSGMKSIGSGDSGLQIPMIAAPAGRIRIGRVVGLSKNTIEAGDPDNYRFNFLATSSGEPQKTVLDTSTAATGASGITQLVPWDVKFPKFVLSQSQMLYVEISGQGSVGNLDDFQLQVDYVPVD